MSLTQLGRRNSITHFQPHNVPEANLCAKKSRAEKKREDRTQKRQLTQHISDPFKENLTMSVLAEGESLSSYNRKQLALSFESATQSNGKNCIPLTS